jgi:hypothetical protein
LGCRGAQSVFVAGQKHHACAAFSQFQGHGPSDALGASAHQSCFVRQIVQHDAKVRQRKKARSMERAF